jgi:hypothetical protein
VSKKRRVYIPEITGAYATEEQILSRAREYFLIMVQTHTPKPLVALRNEVFPKYRSAFKAQELQGKSKAEITALAARAFIDAVLGDETESLTVSTEFKHAQEATHGLYEASKALIDWSRTFNLRGKQIKIDQDADPPVVDAARKDQLWPLHAALGTIFHWHFAPAGWLSEKRTPPQWRPPLHLFKDSPVAFETLPPIQLRSIAPWQPENAEERAAVTALREDAERRVIEVYRSGAADPAAKVTEIANHLRRQMASYPKETEIDTPDWVVTRETEHEFRRRVHQSLDRWLGPHIEKRRECARSLGLIEVPGPREDMHFEWAAKYQVEWMSASRIVEECRKKGIHISDSGVEDAVQRVLNTIRLERRPGKRGAKAREVIGKR